MSNDKSHHNPVDWPLITLSSFILFALFYVLYKLLNGSQITHVEVVMSIITSLTGTLGVLIGYKWGASSGSVRKDATIQALAATPASPTTTVDNIEKVTVESPK